MGGEAALAASSHDPHLGASARAHPRTPARCRLYAQAVAAAQRSDCHRTGASISGVPGKYEFYSCEQLLPQRAYHESREQKLNLLMDKARQSTGGAAISLTAYHAEYTATQEEHKVIAATAPLKKTSKPTNTCTP